MIYNKTPILALPQPLNIGLKRVKIKYGRGTENADNSSENTSAQSINNFLTSTYIT